MIRLFIAFGEWLKLNFNVLSGNFISLLSVYVEWHGKNESCWPKWPENINWPSGPIFVQFDWPDRKYTGHGPAVTSTPDIGYYPILSRCSVEGHTRSWIFINLSSCLQMLQKTIHYRMTPPFALPWPKDKKTHFNDQQNTTQKTFFFIYFVCFFLTEIMVWVIHMSRQMLKP